MSTNSECEFVEVKPNEWYYILEHTHAPQNSWDWREYASCWGPFSTVDEAVGHLGKHHANPGGWSTDEYTEGRVSDEVEKKLIAGARR